MSELQIRRDDISVTRIVERERPEPAEGEVLLRVDRFGYSANNVTYAVAGDTLNYWRFFPTGDEMWGLVPVWGFAEVVASNTVEIAVGERLFGYLPPRKHLVVKPSRVGAEQFVDATPHRAELAAGYNVYRRTGAMSADAEARHMLLWPLYVTSWCLADALERDRRFGAERIVVASASSKTAIGLAFALSRQKERVPVTGLTSRRNVAFVEGLGLYDTVLAYDDLGTLDGTPTAIVDMSGDAAMLGRLHRHLGDAMRRTLDVGLTHWEAPRRAEGRNRERSTFFFAPAHIQERIRQWGPQTFAERTGAFMREATEDSRRWLELEEVFGLEALAKLHVAIAQGTSDAAKGFVVTP